MKSLLTRVFSAIIAVVGIGSLYYFFDNFGFKILVGIAVVIGSYELSRLFFDEKINRPFKFLFYLSCLFNFSIAVFYPGQLGLALSLVSITVCALACIFNDAFENLIAVRDFLTKSLLGFLYISILPSYAWRIQELENGSWWFAFLLIIVFSGDIFAYACGSLWGKTKLIPSISPKKSLQGSIGGLAGSAASAYALYLINPFASWQSLVLLALLTGVMAQLGDFFESLLKRIANLKDSGGIMPGHGGVLDRIDGVLFASPVVFLGAMLLSN